MRDKIKFSPPGPRTIKTALSVAVCVVLYSFLINRDGVMMAITAAIICLQDSVEKSITLGKCRVIGTLAGGFLGAACLSAGLMEYGSIGIILCSFLGIIAIIHFFHTVKMPQSSVISAIVFMIIITSVLTEASDTEIIPVPYSVNRVIDTLIGIMVSVTINISLFRPVERVENTAAAPPVYEISAKDYSRVSKWAGGNTTELYIFPEDTFYSNKNFDFRISTATVEMENSAFTKLPGYKRYIMSLDGTMHLSHEHYHNITLRPFEKDFFLGSWNTESSGRCSDFNLMVTENLSGKIDAVLSGHEEKFTSGSFNGFYCLCDGVTAKIARGSSLKSEPLNKGDFLMFKQEPSSPDTEYSVSFSLTGEAQYAAVMASVYFENSN